MHAAANLDDTAGALCQVAARAQRASVEPSEIVRYEQYDAKHGARYVAHDASQAPMDEDDW